MKFGVKFLEFAEGLGSLSRRVQLLPKPNPKQLLFCRLANKREVNDQSCHNLIISKCQMEYRRKKSQQHFVSWKITIQWIISQSQRLSLCDMFNKVTFTSWTPIIDLIENEEDTISTLMIRRYKPSSASSETVGGGPGNAVDGVATIVHEVQPDSQTHPENHLWNCVAQ